MIFPEFDQRKSSICNIEVTIRNIAFVYKDFTLRYKKLKKKISLLLKILNKSLMANSEKRVQLFCIVKGFQIGH